ncbi:MAG: DUF4400 domain-containing protein [Gammaproteobacteria bacterium]|nr:DUF4400 domain-containing protein [Gammaproteobacteria bacterium]
MSKLLCHLVLVGLLSLLAVTLYDTLCWLQHPSMALAQLQMRVAVNQQFIYDYPPLIHVPQPTVERLLLSGLHHGRQWLGLSADWETFFALVGTQWCQQFTLALPWGVTGGLLMLTGMVDGLTQRAIRRWSGERERLRYYLLAKQLGMIGLTWIVVCQMLPLPPQRIMQGVISGYLITAIALQIKNHWFKKY